MPRYAFPASVVLLPPDDEGVARVATYTPFTLWTANTGGEQHTDLVAADGVSDLEPVTDHLGQTPELRGPDEVKAAWVDIGSGFRFPLYAYEAMEWLLNNYDGPTDVGDIDGGVI